MNDKYMLIDRFTDKVLAAGEIHYCLEMLKQIVSYNNLGITRAKDQFALVERKELTPAEWREVFREEI